MLAVLTVLALALYFTPLLGVRSIQVRGAATLTRDDVLTAARLERGEPMLRLDAGDIRTRIRTLPQVATAEVTLSWPSAVRVDITERTPAAFTASPDGARLVDAAGVSFATRPQPPAGLPELRAASVSSKDPATRAALAVLRTLPRSVRADTTTVVAGSPQNIRLLLRGNREVDWGGPQQSTRKAAILPPLLTRQGKVYDVSAPSLPTVS